MLARPLRPRRVSGHHVGRADCVELVRLGDRCVGELPAWAFRPKRRGAVVAACLSQPSSASATTYRSV